jgi:hypothetical protein
MLIQEQSIRDVPSGITIDVWHVPGGEGRIRLTGDFPFGNRDFQFDEAGTLVGTGTALGGACAASGQALVTAGQLPVGGAVLGQ